MEIEPARSYAQKSAVEASFSSELSELEMMRERMKKRLEILRKDSQESADIETPLLSKQSYNRN